MVFPLIIAKGVASGISWLMGRRFKKKTKTSLETLQMQLKLIAGSMAGIPPQAMENIKTEEDLIAVLEKVGIHNKENPRGKGILAVIIFCAIYTFFIFHILRPCLFNNALSRISSSQSIVCVFPLRLSKIKVDLLSQGAY